MHSGESSFFLINVFPSICQVKALCCRMPEPLLATIVAGTGGSKSIPTTENSGMNLLITARASL